MHLLINQIYDRIFKIWRFKRFALFVRLIEPQAHQRLLDVGGYPSFWLQYQPVAKSIDTLNIYPMAWNNHAFPEYNIQTLLGDACNLPLADRSYDIVHSNSVIEHVGNWQRQQAFAREIRRIGKRLWIQTPAFICPIEPHYLAPFIHWLPKKIQRKILPFTPRVLIEKTPQSEINEMIENTRLLKKWEMKQLFPDCEIRTEYLLGIIPKSYIAIRIID